MNKKNTLLQIGLPILMIIVMLAQSIPVQAQTIVTIQPNVVVNTSTVNLVITGSGFQDGAQVIL